MHVSAQRLEGGSGVWASDGPIPLATTRDYVGSVWCTAAWICLHEPPSSALLSQVPPCITSHQWEPVLPVSDLSVQNTQESPAQLQPHKGRGLSSHLHHYRSIRALGFLSRKHQDNSSGSSHCCFLTRPIGLVRTSTAFTFFPDLFA